MGGTRCAELFANHTLTQGLESQVLQADGDGAEFDMQDHDDLLILFNIGATGDTLGENDYIECQVLDGDTSGALTAAANADVTNYVTGSATGTVAKIDANTKDSLLVAVGYKGSYRYVQGFINVVGTHTNGIPCSIDYIGAKQIVPVNSET